MSREERPVVWGRRVLAFWARCCLCGYWCVVGEGFPPPLFLFACRLTGRARGVSHVFVWECDRLWLVFILAREVRPLAAWCGVARSLAGAG